MSHPNQTRRVAEIDSVSTSIGNDPADAALARILDEIEAEQKQQAAKKETPPVPVERPGRQATPYGFD